MSSTRPGDYSVAALARRVIQGGYCVGCGACAAAQDSSLTLRLDELGMYAPEGFAGNAQGEAKLGRYCPFLAPETEDDLGRSLFPDCTNKDEHLGRYLSTWVGHVATGDYRSRGSSGGMVSWLLTTLLKLGLVDAIIHVAPGSTQTTNAPLFQYRISRTPEEVRAGAKSRYYPVEISTVMQMARSEDLRYAFVGVPCFVKAVRLLQLHESWARERIRFCVGLVCGHLKSARFGEFLAWQCGVKPGELRQIDFRWKLDGRPADRYGIKVAYERQNGLHTLVRPMDELTGDAWGHCLFQVPACNYCDDVVAETADIAIGDAWLPDYTADSGGTNIVINRSEKLEQLLTYGVKNKELELRRIAPEVVVKSQAGGFRQRREGLTIRLHNRKQNQEWAPTKRVSALPLVKDRKRQELILLREQMAHASHVAFQEARKSGSLTPYFEHMAPLDRRYTQLTRVSLARRLMGFPLRPLKRIIRLFQ